MVDIEKVENLKTYFKKLQKILTYEADFKFADYALVKKSKIDDILCCIIPTLPDAYKKMMRKSDKKLNSMLSYELIFKTIKHKFVLNSNVYIVKYKNAIKYINSFIRDIEKDVEYAEKHAE